MSRQYLEVVEEGLKKELDEGRAEKFGKLDEYSIAFEISQINKEFYNYVLNNIKPLKAL